MKASKYLFFMLLFKSLTSFAQNDFKCKTCYDIDCLKEEPNILAVNKLVVKNIKEGKIFENILKYKKIEILEIEGINLSNIFFTDISCVLTNLTTIRIENCGIKSFPYQLFRLKKLKHLDFSKNLLEKFYSKDELNIKYLNLSENRLLFFEIENAKELKELDLAYNPDNHFYKISECPLLEELDLSYNNVDKIDFRDIKSLRKLEMNMCNIVFINPSVFELKHLSELYLTRNKIKSIQHSFLKLKKLKVLELSGNKIENIPHWFVGLKNIEELGLNANMILTIDSIFFKMKKLIRLELAHNNIKEFVLPNEESSIQVLGLYNNQLQSLPKYLFTKMDELYCLDVGNNRISSLPVDLIIESETLFILNVHNNNISNMKLEKLKKKREDLHLTFFYDSETCPR